MLLLPGDIRILLSLSELCFVTEFHMIAVSLSVGHDWLMISWQIRVFHFSEVFNGVC